VLNNRRAQVTKSGAQWRSRLLLEDNMRAFQIWLLIDLKNSCGLEEPRISFARLGKFFRPNLVVQGAWHCGDQQWLWKYKHCRVWSTSLPLKPWDESPVGQSLACIGSTELARHSSSFLSIPCFWEFLVKDTFHLKLDSSPYEQLWFEDPTLGDVRERFQGTALLQIAHPTHSGILEAENTKMQSKT